MLLAVERMLDLLPLCSQAQADDGPKTCWAGAFLKNLSESTEVGSFKVKCTPLEEHKCCSWEREWLFAPHSHGRKKAFALRFVRSYYKSGPESRFRYALTGTRYFTLYIGMADKSDSMLPQEESPRKGDCFIFLYTKHAMLNSADRTQYRWIYQTNETSYNVDFHDFLTSSLTYYSDCNSFSNWFLDFINQYVGSNIQHPSRVDANGNRVNSDSDMAFSMAYVHSESLLHEKRFMIRYKKKGLSTRIYELSVALYVDGTTDLQNNNIEGLMKAMQTSCVYEFEDLNE
jgi:hypothetical protein